MQRHLMLIVDGYNVIRNNDRYRSLGDDFDGGEGWNTARETLISDAATFARGDYERCTVVFDGAGNPSSDGVPEHKAGIEVIFSPAGVSADSVIEKLAHDARDSGFEVVVVSSDFAIQSTVFGGGVTRMSASDFARSTNQTYEEQQDSDANLHGKRTLADRIDPEVAERLSRMVRDD